MRSALMRDMKCDYFLQNTATIFFSQIMLRFQLKVQCAAESSTHNLIQSCFNFTYAALKLFYQKSHKKIHLDKADLNNYVSNT